LAAPAAPYRPEIEARLETGGRLHEQTVMLGDFPANKVWLIAVEKRHVGAPLEQDDPGVSLQPTRALPKWPRGRRRQ